MRQLIGWLISLIKGERFQLDERIPSSYVGLLAIKRLVAFLRGFVLFRTVKKFLFVGVNVRILCATKIFAQGPAIFADDSYVDALAIGGVVIGKNFSLGRGASIECTGSLKQMGIGFRAGNNVGIGSFSYVGSAGGVRIGDDTILGNYVSIHSENHNIDDLSMPIRLQGVTRKGVSIGADCWIGAKVIILDGVRIGNHCVVAAGAVVTQGDYEDFVILAGVPARIVGSRRK